MYSKTRDESNGVKMITGTATGGSSTSVSAGPHAYRK